MGYKLHLLTTLDGLVTDFVMTPANIDDRAAVWDLVASYNNITMLGDKGYTKADLGVDLKSEKGIDLLLVQKNNSQARFPKTTRQLVFRLRRRIETTASQLAGQLNIEQVVAKSFWGLQARIKTKLLAYNLCYYINKLIGQNINISKIKHLVFG